MYTPDDARHPYLVSRPICSPVNHVGMTHTSESTSASLEDVEMDMDGDEKSTDYVALDTNILINHLHLVRQIYTILRTIPSAYNLLVPTILINELDKLKSSQMDAGTTPEGQVTLGDLAKAATRWLLETNQAQRKDHNRIIRFQRWSERLNPSLDKPDDRILDCCLFFQQKGHVTLWTNDKNLALLAEGNDILSIGHQSIQLESLLRFFSIDMTKEKLDDIRKNHPPTLILPHQVEEEDTMEIEDRHVLPPSPPPTASSRSVPFTNDPFRRPLTPSPPTSPRQSTSIRTLPSSTIPPSSRRPIVSSTAIPPELIDRLLNTLRPAIQILRPDTTPSDPTRQLTDFRSALLEHEQRLGRSTEFGMALLRSVDAIRIITTFLEPSSTGRVRRLGQVGEAIEVLGAMLFDLQLLDARGELVEIANVIRAL